MKIDPLDWAARSRELEELLARTALGDRAAFARLYRRTSAHLYAVLRRILRDTGAAEDALQELYVSVWRAAGSFDAGRSQPLTWLTHMARNKAIDSLRRVDARPRAASEVAGDDAASEPLEAGVPDPAPGPVELLDRAGEAREIARCLGGLSPQQRQSIALAFFDGLTHAEVAERLRQPLGTVKSWVRRALGVLRECLDRAGVAGGPPAAKA